MMRRSEVSVVDQVKRVPPVVRPIVRAARRTVRSIAPRAVEVAYQSSPPRSKSMMWKLSRYTVDGSPVVGIGSFSTYAVLFFYRGRELDEGSGLLEGAGKDARFTRLRTRADAERPAFKRLVRRAFELAG